MRGLFWFRNDLRIEDNPAFSRMAKLCDNLLCVYVVDERWFRWTRFQAKSLGAKRAAFINQSIADLQGALAKKGQELIVLTGKPEQILAETIDSYRIDAIGVTRLPATYERRQLKRIMTAYPDKGWIIEDSFTLFGERELPFMVMNLPDQFTPFRKLAEFIAIPSCIKAPDRIPEPIVFAGPQSNPLQESARKESAIWFKGGAKAGITQLHYYFDQTGLVSRYKETRNGLDGWDFSSKLSPWLAQGCLSPKQVVSELRAYESQYGANESTYWLYFELLWREYFQWLLYKYGSKLFQLRGTRNVNPLLTFYPQGYTAWINGNTESDFVNALMRQLKSTGWMSNRGRQIAASYLINELGVDWRYGAAWFEEQLIDYDPASNWGNWQYLAGVGVDPRGRRRFNILKQQEEFDPGNEFTNKYSKLIIDS